MSQSLKRSDTMNDPVKARRLKWFGYSLLLCVVLLFASYLAAIRVSYTGRGIQTFRTRLTFENYVFVEADDSLYIIDETYVDLKGEFWNHVVHSGERKTFDVNRMEKPYQFFEHTYFFPHCDVAKLTKENPLVKKINEIEKSYNISAPSIEIGSLKIPETLELKEIVKYSQAFDDAMRWVIEKTLRWNEFLDGYLPAQKRDVKDLLQIKVKIQCLFNNIKSDSSIHGQIKFTRNEVLLKVDELQGHEVHHFWTWENNISSQVLRQIMLSLQTIAEIAKRAHSAKSDKVTPVIQ